MYIYFAKYLKDIFVEEHVNMGYFSLLGTQVCVDKYCDTCIAGGVFIRGLHATTAPRRHDTHQPVYEKYSFVPYTTSQSLKYSETLQSYAQQCSQQAYAGLNFLLEQHGNNGLKSKDQIRAAVQNLDSSCGEPASSVEKVDEKSGFLGVLQKIFDMPYTDVFTDDVERTVKENSKSLKTDVLLTYLFSTETFKPCLDLVVENVPTNNLKVLEVCNTGVISHIEHLLASHPLLQPIFSLASTDSTAEVPEGVDAVKWSLGDKPPTSMKKSHLVIANNVLHKQKSISKALNNALACLEDGGFILVHEQTNNFHLALPLDKLGDVADPVEDLDSRSCGIYCTTDKWKEIFTAEGLEVVYERSDTFMSTLFLLKKCSEQVVEKQRMLNVTDMECVWVEELKSEIALLQSRPKGENLWLLADTNISGIMGMVNCLRQELGGERIRYAVFMELAF